MMILRGAVRSRLCNTQWAPSILTSSKRNNPPNARSGIMTRNEFADPYGKSALRAESKSNPRNLPCPTCKEPDRLTLKDRRLGYQCGQCADMQEGGY